MSFAAPNAGLCSTCKHQRCISTARGAKFVMCLRSETDPRFAKYPGLPVRQCSGYVSTPDLEREQGS